MRAGNPTIIAVTPGGPPNSQCEWVSASRSLRRASSVTTIDELELFLPSVDGAAFKLRLDVFLAARLTGPSFAMAAESYKGVCRIGGAGSRGRYSLGLVSSAHRTTFMPERSSTLLLRRVNRRRVR